MPIEIFYQLLQRLPDANKIESQILSRQQELPDTYYISLAFNIDWPATIKQKRASLRKEAEISEEEDKTSTKAEDTAVISASQQPII